MAMLSLDLSSRRWESSRYLDCDSDEDALTVDV